MSNGDDKRERALLRFLFANFGGLLSLAGVLVSVGMMVKDSELQSEAIRNLRAEVREVAAEVSAIKGKIAGYDVEFNYLRRKP